MFVEDSLLSSNLGTNLLGSMNDPEMGSYEAAFYTQFQLAGLSPDFGDISTIVLDSFVLGLEYKGYYGNLDAQNFVVSELQEDIHLDSSYYSNQSKAVSSSNMIMSGKETVSPDPINPTIIDGKEVDPQLRLHLDTNIAKTLINETISNPEYFSSNENFQAHFKGVKVSVNNPGQASGKGAILYLNINDPLSKMTIYYTQSGVKKSFDFLINDQCADFNQINIVNSTKVQNVINNPSAGNTEFYVQANKSRAFIELTTIDDIPKNAIIQYAKLELPVSFYSNDAYYPSTIITSASKIEGEDNAFELWESAAYSDYTKSYVLDVKAYVQAVVNGNVENNGLYLSPAKMVSSSERIIFNGLNTDNKKKPKLKIVYTIF